MRQAAFGCLAFVVSALAGSSAALAARPLGLTDSSAVLVVEPRPNPPFMTPTTDSTFGTRVVRIADDPGNPFAGGAVAGRWGRDVRHHYFTDQPWNSDGTLLALQNRQGGDPSLLILDGETYQVKYGRCPDFSGDDRWHPSPAHPHERIAVNGNHLMWYDVVDCVETRSWTLPFDVLYIGNSNGNPSADGRFVALCDSARVFVVDMDPQPPLAPYPSERIGPAYDVGSCNLPEGCEIAWASISPSGRYVVVSYTGGHPRVFDVDPKTLALSPHPIPATAPVCSGGDPLQGFIYDLAQSDLTQDPFDGDEDVLVGQEHCGKRGKIISGKVMGGVVKVRLRDGAVTPLTTPDNEAYPQSVSARNDQRPGWVYVGYYPQDGRRFTDEVMAVKLDGSGSVERFTQKRSLYKGCYRCTPQPVPSRDGMRVLWASNWATDCSQCGDPNVVRPYVMDARAAVAPNQPPDAAIDAPAADVTLTAGDSVAFAATGADPDGDLPLQFSWDFGGGAPDRSVEDPGPVVFATPGLYVVTLTVTDARGLADPTPATRTITVIPPPVTGPPHQVHWTIMGPTAVSFDWVGSSNRIRYGLTPDYGDSVTATVPIPTPFSSPGPFREARLTGLREDTLYHYQIGDGGDHTFRTPPPRGSSGFTVYAYGDIGSTRETPRVGIMQQQVADDLPRFCLLLGDLTYGNAHGLASVDQHFEDVMPWSQDAAYMPVWGNHEWDEPLADDLRNYKGRFDLPNPQTSPGAPAVSCCGEDWYWFDYGNVRFIAIPEPWPSGAQADWSKRADSLMTDAQNDPAIRFIVTFGHRPTYSSGHHPGLVSLQRYLDALGAAHSKYVLDLCGHSHDYERTVPLYGVTHITSGAGGASLEDDPSGDCLWRGGCPPPAWSAFRAFHHANLKLEFTARSIEGWAICGPAATPNDVTCTLGSPMDHFIIGAPVDHAPVVSAPEQVSGLRGSAVRVAVSAADPDGDPIDSLVADLSALPAGAQAAFTAEPGNASGTLIWFPTAADTAGSYRVSFIAANALADTATTTITLADSVAVVNLIGNPSFERDSTRGWAAYANAQIARVPGGVDGDYCLQISGGASATHSRFGLNDTPNWIAATAAGTRYRFAAWVRSSDPGAGSAMLRVREYLSSKLQGVNAYSDVVPLAADWRQISVDYSALQDGSTLDFQVLCDPDSGGTHFQVDAISCVIPTVPGPAAAVPRGAAPPTSTATGTDGSGPRFTARVYPSPFHERSVLSFTTTRRGPLEVALFDVNGRRLRVLADEPEAVAGPHQLSIDGRDGRGQRLPAGVYLYRIRAGEGTLTGRCVIL